MIFVVFAFTLCLWVFFGCFSNKGVVLHLYTLGDFFQCGSTHVSFRCLPCFVQCLYRLPLLDVNFRLCASAWILALDLKLRIFSSVRLVKDHARALFSVEGGGSEWFLLSGPRGSIVVWSFPNGRDLKENKRVADVNSSWKIAVRQVHPIAVFHD